MNALLIDHLTNACMLKHAEEVDSEVASFAESDADERKRKLRTGLLALGILGVGGATAWALRGPIGEAIGRTGNQVFGNETPADKLKAQMTSAVNIGGSTAVAAAAARGLGKVKAELAGTNVTPPPIEPTVAGSMQTDIATKLLPNYSPASLSKDLQRAEVAAAPTSGGAKPVGQGEHWYSKLTRPDVPAEAVQSVNAFTKFLTDEQERLKADPNVKLPAGSVVGTKGLLNTLSNVADSPHNNPLAGSATGISLASPHAGGAPIPIEAAKSLSPIELLNSFKNGTTVHSFDTSGNVIATQVDMTKPLAAGPAGHTGVLDVQNRLNDAVTANLSAAHSKQWQVKNFISKQQGLGDLVGMYNKLESLKGTQVALPGLTPEEGTNVLNNATRALSNEITKRYWDGVRAETGYMPPANATPARVDLRSAVDRATAYKALTSGISAQRYSPGMLGVRYLQSGVRPGLAAAAATGVAHYFMPEPSAPVSAER